MQPRPCLLRAVLPVLLAALPLAQEPSRGGQEGQEGRDADDGAQGEAEARIDQAELERITDEIRAEIEVLRGHAFPRPVEVAVTDREGFLRYARERLDRMTTPEEIAAQELVAKLLGLIPAEMDLLATTLDLLEDQVGGFYDPAEEKFYLLSTFTGGLARIILAHELTHALDDQLHDLDGTLDRLAQHGDATFAYHALVEGSGTSLMNTWTFRNLAELDLGEVEAGGGADLGLEGLEGAPPFLWKPLVAAYMRGAAFLARTESAMAAQMKPYDPESADLAFGDPPRSSEQILHPEKYWDPTQRDDPRPVAIDPTRLPEGWEVLDQDTLGELGLALLVEPPAERGLPDGPMGIISMRYTGPATAGWGGDQYVLLARGNARLLHLVTAWDRPEDAQEFRTALEGVAPHIAASAAAMAEGSRAQGAGHWIASGVPADEVRSTSWIGLSREEAEALVAGLQAHVAPRPSAEADPEALGDGR